MQHVRPGRQQFIPNNISLPSEGDITGQTKPAAYCKCHMAPSLRKRSEQYTEHRSMPTRLHQKLPLAPSRLRDSKPRISTTTEARPTPATVHQHPDLDLREGYGPGLRVNSLIGWWPVQLQHVAGSSYINLTWLDTNSWRQEGVIIDSPSTTL